jgi:hypothetical protein
MKTCDDLCESKEKMVCDKCGKQLCEILETKGNTEDEKQCVNTGFYHIGDKIICSECHENVVGIYT